MLGFKIISLNSETIKFYYYENDAPITVNAFHSLLPFERIFLHARVSGHEFWIDNMPKLDIIQENASVIGEVVLGHSKPIRTKTANYLGIYYGVGKGLDSSNIFTKVIDSDLQKLKDLGHQIWKTGSQNLRFVSIDSASD